MLHLGVDRFATVLTCVVATALIGGVFANRSRPAALGQTAAHLSAETLRHLAGQPDLLAAEALLATIARFDDTLDPHGAGSSAARRAVHTNRRLLLMLGDLMLSAHDLTDAQQGAARAASDSLAEGGYEVAADALEAVPLFADLARCLRRIDDAQVGQRSGPHTAAPLPCTSTASARARPPCAQAA